VTVRPLKHLPAAQWPQTDRRLFEAAYTVGDIFDDDGGAGQHLARASRNTIQFAWGRWLGFLARHYPDSLQVAPDDRLTPERLRAYVEALREEVGPTSLAIYVAGLYGGARLIAPEVDWGWLRALKTRLQGLAEPMDRFERLVSPHLTYDLGLQLMDEAVAIREPKRKSERIYRDGLILAFLSLWPLRRRSLVTLSVGRNLKLYDDRVLIQLFEEDTKARRAESWEVPEDLVPYVKRYLRDIRPRLLSKGDHDAFWPSMKGGALRGGQICEMVKRRTQKAFGKTMALHDFRRAAATFLAMDAPEKVGLVPGVLQHAGPEVGQRFYNLARSTQASRRHVDAVAAAKARLRSGR
jgi:integrase/recombinase XerD